MIMKSNVDHLFITITIKCYDIFVNCNWVATRWQQYSTHLHTNSTQNNTINKNNTISNKNNTINNLIGKSAGRAPSLRVIPLHFTYNRGKNTEKSVRLAEECQLAR